MRSNLIAGEQDESCESEHIREMEAKGKVSTHQVLFDVSENQVCVCLSADEINVGYEK